MSITKNNTRMLEGTLGVDKLSATGTKDATTFLRGDNTFAAPTGSGNSPYFKFALEAATNIGAGFPQDDKLNFGTETFKSTGFASWDGTNNRVVPNTAGYYYINAQVRGNSTSSFTRFYIQIRKNGTDVATADVSYNNLETVVTSSLIYFNGTSDYVDLVISHNHSGDLSLSTYDAHTFLQGFKLA